MKRQVSVDEKLCCQCNDIISSVEIKYFKEYCEVCVELNCTIVPNAELDRLK
jgi:hypothetical protein